MGSGFRVQGSGFRVQGSRLRVQGSGFRVKGSGLRIEGLAWRNAPVFGEAVEERLQVGQHSLQAFMIEADKPCPTAVWVWNFGV